VIGRVATIVGGKGGGRADMAQAGGTMVDKLGEAIRSVQKHISDILGA
jgi:alanyl-tRNA synthetase